MLSSISWNQYFTFMVIAALAYYLFIWLVIYKGKIPALAGIGNLQTPSFHSGDDTAEIAKYIMDEIRPVFTGKTNKNEIILALQQKLKKYADYSEPGFREAVNQYIASESESSCSIRLGELDLRAVWS